MRKGWLGCTIAALLLCFAELPAVAEINGVTFKTSRKR